MGKYIKSTKSKGLLLSKKLLRRLGITKKLLPFVLIAILAISGGAYYAVKSYQHHQQQLKTERARAEYIKNLGSNALVTNVSESLKNNDLNGAQQTVSGNKDADAKANLILSASIYTGQKRYDDALQKLTIAEKKYGLDSTIALNIGQVKQFKGDKAGAKEYYQKAIDAIQVENPKDVDQAVKDIESLIQKLGAN